jgi:hypothetical protein
LLKRFREHTTKIFEKHGMKNVAYWTPLDEPAKSTTLIYVLAHPSREAAAANWKAFQDDPEWKTVRDKSEENGKIVEKVDSTFMALTDFSPGPIKLVQFFGVDRLSSPSMKTTEFALRELQQQLTLPWNGRTSFISAWRTAPDEL